MKATTDIANTGVFEQHHISILTILTIIFIPKNELFLLHM